MAKILLKRVLPSIVGLAVVVLGCLWLYGFIGVKAGWIGPTEVPGLNAISHRHPRTTNASPTTDGKTRFKRIWAILAYPLIDVVPCFSMRE